MKQVISIFLFLLLLQACNDKTFYVDNYNFFYFTSNALDTIQMNLELKDSLEDGTFKAYNNDELLSEGQFEGGLKIGEWKYYNVDTFSINWNIYRNDADNIKISYPNYLSIDENANYPFYAKYIGNDSTFKYDYFVLLQHDVDSLGKNLNQYAQYYYNEINNHEQINNYIGYLFELDEHEYLYFEYDLFDKAKGKEIMLLIFISRQGNKILDFTYASNYDNEMKNKTIFFQALTSCFLNGERFFSPFKEMKKKKIKIEDCITE